MTTQHTQNTPQHTGKQKASSPYFRTKTRTLTRAPCRRLEAGLLERVLGDDDVLAETVVVAEKQLSALSLELSNELFGEHIASADRWVVGVFFDFL